MHGGCCGTLFDFSAQEVEDLALNGADIIQDDEEKPLLSFAVAACWVLQTLAQYSEEDSDAWVTLANEVASIVTLAAQTVEEERTVPMVKSLLFSLVDIYESLRQCDTQGYITHQLNYKYEKSLRRLLKSDWKEQKQRLKNQVSASAMGLVLFSRRLRHEHDHEQEAHRRPTKKHGNEGGATPR